MEKIFRYYSKDRFNRVTVVAKFENNTLVFAVARCSDKDQFCRKTGRAIAEGRLSKGKFIREVEPILPFNPAEFVGIAQIIAWGVNNNARLIK